MPLPKKSTPTLSFQRRISALAASVLTPISGDAYMRNVRYTGKRIFKLIGQYLAKIRTRVRCIVCSSGVDIFHAFRQRPLLLVTCNRGIDNADDDDDVDNNNAKNKILTLYKYL